MSILRGQLTDRAEKFTLDTSQLTTSRQPIETLVPTNTVIKCKFRPKKEILSYLTGQVIIVDDIFLTETPMALNDILLFDKVYYRVKKVQTLRSPGAKGRKIIGSAARVEIFRH